VRENSNLRKKITYFSYILLYWLNLWVKICFQFIWRLFLPKVLVFKQNVSPRAKLNPSMCHNMNERPNFFSELKKYSWRSKLILFQAIKHKWTKTLTDQTFHLMPAKLQSTVHNKQDSYYQNLWANYYCRLSTSLSIIYQNIVEIT